MGIQVLSPPSIRQQGIEELPKYIYDEFQPLLEAHDPQMYVGLIYKAADPRMARICIFRMREGQVEPLPYHDDIIHVCETESGHYRLPGYRDIEILFAGDSRRPENSYDNLMKARARGEASRQKSWDDIATAISQDLAWRAKKETGLEHNIYMHDPKHKRVNKIR